MTIAKRRFELRRDRIERALRETLPEPITSHYVVIGRRRYPPKQAIGLVTGLDRADFTTHQARRILTGLGFPAGRRSRPPSPEPVAHPARRGAQAMRTRPTAETLEPFVGQWVATKEGEVLVAAPEPSAVVGWLAEHRRQADSMFRVPSDELEAGGLTPW
ncbi:MAG TPA: hypothetical protein VFC30_07805 [Solirubrobacteraceae bacterium]|nr:hypothetical protein [Solirubrobacteraceae bacterium]